MTSPADTAPRPSLPEFDPAGLRIDYSLQVFLRDLATHLYARWYVWQAAREANAAPVRPTEAADEPQQ